MGLYFRKAVLLQKNLIYIYIKLTEKEVWFLSRIRQNAKNSKNQI